MYTGPAFVAAGYRSENISVDEDSVVADITFSGMFVEAGFGF